MTKKILVSILTSILLSACISIKEAPNTPGTQHDFVTATLAPTKINLVRTESIIPSETMTPISAVTSPAKCTDGAILLRDVTIQDDTHVNAGEKFTKTWEFQNAGTCPWVGYTVKFSAGDQMDAPLSAAVADTPPSGKVQVSVELTAPTAEGRYAGYFTLLNSNGAIIPIGTQKTFWVRFIVGTYAMIPALPAVSPMPSGSCIHSGNADYVSQIASLINAERVKAGLQTMTVDAQIAAFAQSHAEDMAFNNFLSHDGSDGSFFDRMRNFAVTHPGYQSLGEILAIGTPQNAMDQWRRDEHWDFVLGGGALIGVGYAYNSCSDYGGYFTVGFG